MESNHEPNRAQTALRSLVAAAALFAMAGRPGAQGCDDLFGSNASAGGILTVSTTTGAGVVLGPHLALGTMPAMATDPTTGILYGATGGGTSNLHTIDPTTGMATLVGDTMLGSLTAVGGLAFDAGGTLYAAVNIVNDGGSGSEHLATIDTSTGLATVVGPFGACPGAPTPCTIEGIEGIAFDDVGTLYGVLSQRGSNFSGAPAGLYTIDPTTGAATFQTALVDAAGTPASGGFVSLERCPCDGVFFGGTATALGGAADGGFLATIDVGTGVFSFVGASSATSGSSLAALAVMLTAASSTVRNGTGVNPIVFSETSPATVGGTWKANVVLGAAAASAVGVSLVGPTTFPTGFGELLVTPPFLTIDLAAGTHCIPIPNDCTLIGLSVFTQAATLPPPTLTNALDLTIGQY